MNPDRKDRIALIGLTVASALVFAWLVVKTGQLFPPFIGAVTVFLGLGYLYVDNDENQVRLRGRARVLLEKLDRSGRD